MQVVTLWHGTRAFIPSGGVQGEVRGQTSFAHSVFGEKLAVVAVEVQICIAIPSCLRIDLLMMSRLWMLPLLNTPWKPATALHAACRNIAEKQSRCLRIICKKHCRPVHTRNKHHSKHTAN